MKNFVWVAIAVILTITTSVGIKHRIESVAYEKQVENAEKGIWVRIMIAASMQAHLRDLCRTDIYAPRYEIPAEAIRECEKARVEFESFKKDSYKAIADFNRLKAAAL